MATGLRDLWLQEHLGKRIVLVIPGAQVLGKVKKIEDPWVELITDDGQAVLCRIEHLQVAQEVPSTAVAKAVLQTVGAMGNGKK